MPTLSICIPNYNMGSTVARAVHSALEVKPKSHVEVVVVDNRSTDDSKCELAQFHGHPRVRIYFEDDHVPIGENWDRTVERSTADWCLVLCADDEVAANFLENIEDDLRCSRWGAISQYVELRGAEDLYDLRFNGDLAPTIYSRPGALATFMARNPLPLNSTVFRRTCFLWVGGFQRAVDPLTSDVEFWLRLIYEANMQVKAVGTLGGIKYPRGGTWARLVQQGIDGPAYFQAMKRCLDAYHSDLSKEERRAADRALRAHARAWLFEGRFPRPRPARVDILRLIGTTYFPPIRMAFWIVAPLLMNDALWPVVKRSVERLRSIRVRLGVRTRVRALLSGG